MEKLLILSLLFSVIGCTNSTTGKMVFQSYRDGNAEIYLANIDGSNLKNLTNNPAQDISPALSPDGTKIAFVSNRDSHFPNIYVMDTNGSSIRKLTDDTSHNMNPSWSADGKKIAFISNRDGQFELFVMNTDGSNVEKLTDKNTFDSLPIRSGYK